MGEVSCSLYSCHGRPRAPLVLSPAHEALNPNHSQKYYLRLDIAATTDYLSDATSGPGTLKQAGGLEDDNKSKVLVLMILSSFKRLKH